MSLILRGLSRNQKTIAGQQWQPLDPSVGWLLRAIDGRPLNARQTQTRDGLHGSTQTIPVPFFDMPSFDNYSVVVSPDGYSDCGWFPVQADDSRAAIVDLLALPKNPSANFASATWAKLSAARPGIADIIRRGNGGSDAAAEAAWGILIERRPLAIACFLNITTALSQIALPAKKPLDYYWNIAWPAGDSADPAWLANLDKVFKQDRFFCYVDARILPDLHDAVKQGAYVPESQADLKIHGDATESYKQTQFDVANVQLTFHGKDAPSLPGPDGNPIPCIKVEPDIDYYKDPLAHGLLEFLPNLIPGKFTDPRSVYMLRWMAGRRVPGLAEFDPLFTIEGAAAAGEV